MYNLITLIVKVQKCDLCDVTPFKEPKETISLQPYTLHLIRDLIAQFNNNAVNINNHYQLDQRIEYLLPMVIGLFIGMVTAMICYNYGVDGITANELIDWILLMPCMEFEKLKRKRMSNITLQC